MGVFIKRRNLDTERDTRMGRMPCEHRDRDEGHVSTRQGKPKLAKLPEAMKRQVRIPSSPGFRGSIALTTPLFHILPSRISVVLSHSVFNGIF